jgi:hypothetical protein
MATLDGYVIRPASQKGNPSVVSGSQFTREWAFHCHRRIDAHVAAYLNWQTVEQVRIVQDQNSGRSIITSLANNMAVTGSPTTQLLTNMGPLRVCMPDGTKKDFHWVSLLLAPFDSSGRDVCPRSTIVCRAACQGTFNLNEVNASRLGIPSSWAEALRKLQRAKTRQFFEDRVSSIKHLCNELEGWYENAAENGRGLLCSLNVYSDLPWETAALGAIPQRFPDIQFWDFSRDYQRAEGLPKNYEICWSWSEIEQDQMECYRLLNNGWNVAVVFWQSGRGLLGLKSYDQHIPKHFIVRGEQFEVYDGDRTRFVLSDHLRLAKRPGRICGLRLKAVSFAVREAALQSGFAQLHNP